MTSAHIEISSSSTRTSAQVRSAIDQLKSSIQSIEKLNSIFEQIALGADFISLAGFLGVTEAEAESVYNLWTASVTELRATNITQLLSRCG